MCILSSQFLPLFFSFPVCLRRRRTSFHHPIALCVARHARRGFFHIRFHFFLLLLLLNHIKSSLRQTDEKQHAAQRNPAIRSMVVRRDFDDSSNNKMKREKNTKILDNFFSGFLIKLSKWEKSHAVTHHHRLNESDDRMNARIKRGKNGSKVVVCNCIMFEYNA